MALREPISQNFGIERVKLLTWHCIACIIVRFREQILKDFQEDFAQTFGEQDTEWLLAILHREMGVENDEVLYKDKYLGITHGGGE